VSHETRRLKIIVVSALVAVCGGLFAWRIVLAHERKPSAPAQEVVAASFQSRPAIAPSIQKEMPKNKISGRVTFNKRPFAGAIVRVEPDPKVGGDGPHETVSDQVGHFDFGELTRSAYSISASAPTLTRAIRYLDLRVPDTRGDNVELEMTACEARLSGRVLDAAGSGIVHAHVRLRSSAGADSGPDGAYALCVPPGKIEVKVDADGYGPMRFTLVAAGHTKHDFILVPAGYLIGRVVRGTSDLPVAAAQVTAHSATPGPDQTALVASPTDDAGRFTIAVAPGRHMINAVAPDGSATVMPVIASVLAGQRTEEIVLRITPSAVRVLGIVRNRGVPVPGARVMSISKAVATRVQGVSGADGRFELNAVLPGDTLFNVANYKVVAPKNVMISTSDSFVEIEVERGASIRGTITHAGQPVPGARITARAGVIPHAATSASDGTYALDGLEAGHYELVAQSEPVGAVGRAQLDITDNEARTFDLDLKYGASISGTVLSETGPVTDAKVVFKHTGTDDDGMTVTDDKGAYKCTQLAGRGTYEAYVYSPGGAELAPRGDRASVVLEDESTHLEGLTLSVSFARSKIKGRVVTQSGDPVPDSQVRAASDNMEQGSLLSESTEVPTDQQGRFTIDVAANQSWTISARGPDGSQGSQSGIMSGSSDAEIRIKGGGVIEGQLVGFTTQPIVYAVMGRDEPHAMLGQVDDGSFKILVPAGRMMVTAMSSSEGDAQMVDVQPDQTSHLTLTAQGSSRVTGTVVEHGSNTAVAGMACHALMRSAGNVGLTNWSLEAAAQTDANGAFELSQAPAGDISVVCVGNGNLISSGSANLSVAAGGQGSVVLEVVRRTGNSVPGSVGITWVPGDTGAEVGWLEPGNSAAAAAVRPGEVASAVDGLSVERVNAFGMMILVANHPPGSVLTLTTVAGGQPVTRKLAVHRD